MSMYKEYFYWLFDKLLMQSSQQVFNTVDMFI